ncbi:MAG: ABC transporter ATP-binding protein [Clostridiales bacterium]|nr:ABC transporter ATP-binding protein [Clostridiales bacterium]
MIEVSSLKYQYQNNDSQTINDISFDIQKGEVFGFLGPSGAGKTTTQKIITGLLTNYEGDIRIMGKNRSDWGRDFYEKIGVAFEFPNLYMKLTAIENLELFLSYYVNKNDDLDMLLDNVGLLAYKKKKIEDFSKGMKVRLNFIRAIQHNPDIIFLDEPTSGLDPVNANIIKQYIKRLKCEGKTIFLTTHNMGVATQICDRVAFIVDGKLRAIDNPKNLMLQYGKREVAIEYIEKKKVIKKYHAIDGIGENSEFLDVLKNNEIKTIHTSEATLEDIFIKVTGRSIQ